MTGMLKQGGRLFLSDVVFAAENYEANISKWLATLRNTLAQRGPCVVNAPIHDAENVFPVVPPGAANRDMIGGKIRT